MTYGQAVKFHESAKQYGSILGLDAIRALMHELRDVWKKLNIVHIAGTNGKGSVSCFLASVLAKAGYSVGQFNSPAVFDLREVYRINGRWICREEYALCMEEVFYACNRMKKKGLPHPTVFEIETALAFLWFYRRKCDIILLETGMGGSTDATNLIQNPLCSIFVPISMDHMQFLGNSPEEIAKVKSGIIKEGCPVITAKQPPKADAVLYQAAAAHRAPYHKAPDIGTSRIAEGKLCYCYPGLGELHLSMRGAYQVENSALAVKALQVLQEIGYPVTKNQLCKGIEAAHWEGRFECILNAPVFYLDGAHNTAAAEKLKQSLINNYPHWKRIGIMGVMADKPYGEMLDILQPVFEQIYTVTPDHPRALPADILAEEARKRNIKVSAEADIPAAVRCAYQTAAEKIENTMAIAFGSLYFLKEVKNALHEITGD